MAFRSSKCPEVTLPDRRSILRIVFSFFPANLHNGLNSHGSQTAVSWLYKPVSCYHLPVCHPICMQDIIFTVLHTEMGCLNCNVQMGCLYAGSDLEFLGLRESRYPIPTSLFIKVGHLSAQMCCVDAGLHLDCWSRLFKWVTCFANRES